jgi:hypothetical protein
MMKKSTLDLKYLLTFLFIYYVSSIFRTLKVDRFGVGKNDHYLHLLQLFDSKCIVKKKKDVYSIVYNTFNFHTNVTICIMTYMWMCCMVVPCEIIDFHWILWHMARHQNNYRKKIVRFFSHPLQWWDQIKGWCLFSQLMIYIWIPIS